jgi:hypothetical protein
MPKCWILGELWLKHRYLAAILNLSAILKQSKLVGFLTSVIITNVHYLHQTIAKDRLKKLENLRSYSKKSYFDPPSWIDPPFFTDITKYDLMSCF